MPTLLIALAAALSPANPASMVSAAQMERVRDRWLWLILALATVWLAGREPWLACLALWYLLRWRSPGYTRESNEYHRGLLTWLGIGATWFLLRSLPRETFDYLPWAWLAIAFAHVGYIVYMHSTQDLSWFKRPSLGKRLKATQGSPVITALSFALVAPFCPWWGWPVLGLGLYLTWSWLAFLAIGVAYAWLYPGLAGYIALSGAAAAMLMRWAPSFRGQRLLEWTPRGDSIDGWTARTVCFRLCVAGWWEGPRFLGRGPYTVTHELQRWGSRIKDRADGITFDISGEAHCEPGQVLYEYGVLGVLAAALFVGRVLVGSHLGDPYAAAFLGGLVMTLAHWAPARQPAVALTWLTIAAGVLR